MPRYTLESVAKHYGFTMPLAPGSMAGLMTSVLRDNPCISTVTTRPECATCIYECDCRFKHVGRACNRYEPDWTVVLLDLKPWQVS